MAYLIIDGVVMYVHVYFPILFLREKEGVFTPSQACLFGFDTPIDS